MTSAAHVLCAVAALGTTVFGVHQMNNVKSAQPRGHVASNAYSWYTYFSREGRDFHRDLNASLKAVRQSGSDGLEPLLETAEDAKRMGEALRSNGLEMRSAYVNTTLHREDAVGPSIRSVMEIAREARKYGTRIIVTNPVPLRWGGMEDKSDSELRTQARALNDLGRELKTLGMVLAYHNHDSELRQAARELHHMMVGTDPKYVKLCLDVHWIYRGSGNSEVALRDFVRLYVRRIVEVHVRQSQGGTWSEVFGGGDIDSIPIVETLKAARVRAHIVVEQAVEAGTPHTMDAETAMRRSIEQVRSLFAGVSRM